MIRKITPKAQPGPRNRHSNGLAPESVPTATVRFSRAAGRKHRLIAPPKSLASILPGRLARLPACAALIGTLIAPAVSPAVADPVPMPRPAPASRNRVVAAAPTPVQMAGANQPLSITAGGAAAAAKPGAQQSEPVPTPIIPNPRNRAPTSIFSTLSPAQRTLVARVSNYLTTVQTMVGNFVQVGPDGRRTTGDFYMQKPGKIRFEYDAPSPIAIVADGTSVVVRDRKLATQDVFPLSQTPLRFLLSNQIDLMRDANVVTVTADDLYISVTIEEKHALVGTSRLMLMLDAKDNQLKQWTITDQQGYDTTVAVYNVDLAKRPDPSIFRIDFTNYSSPNQ